jgi:hypothetical protein
MSGLVHGRSSMRTLDSSPSYNTRSIRRETFGCHVPRSNFMEFPPGGVTMHSSLSPASESANVCSEVVEKQCIPTRTTRYVVFVLLCIIGLTRLVTRFRCAPQFNNCGSLTVDYRLTDELDSIGHHPGISLWAARATREARGAAHWDLWKRPFPLRRRGAFAPRHS